jgi:hypothetical protein
VHHRSYDRKGFEAPQDLIVLCDDCHLRHHRRLALDAVRATDREPVQAPIAPSFANPWLTKRA